MKGASKKRRINRAKKVGRFFLAIILCLFTAEVLSRLLLTEDPSSINLRWRDSWVRDRPIRKEAGVVLYHEPFSTRFNTTKPSGTFRIIFLVDLEAYEILEGEVTEKDVFTTILEAFLRYLVTSNQLPEGHNPLVRTYEIFGFSLLSYNLIQFERVFYEALAFEPDLIVYNYFMDSFNATTSLATGSFAGRIGIPLDWSEWSEIKQWLIIYEQSVPYLFPFPGNGKLLLHSRVYRLLNKQMTVVIQKLDPEFTPPSFDVVGGRAEQSLDRMIAAAGREQVPFVIMLSPIFWSNEITGAAEPENPIVDNCHSGLYIWDVPPKLVPFYSPEELRMPGTNDLHLPPNMLGHAVIAEVLQSYLERYVLNQSSIQYLIPSEDREVPCVIV